MKILKKTFRLFAVAMLIAILAFSFTACKKDDKGGSGTGNGENPGGQQPGGNDDPVDPSVKYTVTFENVDEDAYPPISVDKNGTVSVDPPARGDAIFLGWYTDEECMTRPFVMGTTKITANTTLYAKWKTNTSSGEAAKRYVVTFNSDGGSAVDAQSIEEGKCAFSVTPERAGYQFLGWYLDSSKYDFKNVITQNLTLVAHWAQLDPKIQAYGGYNESLYVEWSDGAPSQASVQYKASGTATWVNVDSELIRPVGNSVARVDAVGLKAGDYDVKIQPSSGSALELSGIEVAAYDRSGYAHFNYNKGIGAYKDDGTLKENAIVIYVTEQNKDTVMSAIDAKYKFNVPNYFTNSWNNKQADGIGWWLNNAQYTKCEKNSSGVAIETKSSNTYDPNGGKLGFASLVADNIPICIRFIGKVTTPEGCTAYNSLKEGGTVGDNGHMARMKDLKNVTIEGIGSDATIEGWGFHFMVGDSSNEKGSGFEVRNLIFDKYPEDAVGMEGASKDGSYTANPVSRCWVHHNSFLPGYASPTAESDKSEGDGSCDFKRGEYFTLSYNYFADCHKTNLIGASEKNYQYNISMHHNWWSNCGSRIPLSRNANIHFYNNYVSVDDVAEGISFVHAMEGSGYLFSEGNYYLGCKQITRSGIGKSWQNTYFGCHGNNGLTFVDSRDQTVANSCKYYDGSSLANFDTNPDQFYYNAQTKQSDCLLDDSVTARQKAMQFAGVNDWGKNNPKKKGSSLHAVYRPNINDITPTGTVEVPDEGELDIDFSKTYAGITFKGSVSSGALKGKSQVIGFTLAAPAEVTLASSTSGDAAPDLVRSDGTVYANKVNGSVTVELPAGTYIISCGIYSYESKEVLITKLSFKSTAGSAQAKLENLNNAINAIGTVTLSSGPAIADAQTYLTALKAEEITAFDAAYPGQRDKLTAAQSAYNDLCVNNVITLINNIGTVNDNSYPAIEAARNAYDNLASGLKSSVTNYSDLTAAEADWSNRAVTAIQNQINALEDVTGWTVTSKTKAEITAKKAEYESVKSAYEQLADKSGITNYSKVTDGLTKLDSLLAEIAAAEQAQANLDDFNAKLGAVTAETVDLTSGAALKAAYNKLTTAQQSTIDSAKYNAVIAAYEKLVEDEAKNTVSISFNGSKYTVSENTTATAIGLTVSGSYKTGISVDINETTYTSALKLQSSAGEVKFTMATAKTLTLYFANSVSISLNGTKTTSKAELVSGTSNLYALTITIEADTEYTIKKGDGEGQLLMMVFTQPAE